jgi:hypothetical protein
MRVTQPSPQLTSSADPAAQGNGRVGLCVWGGLSPYCQGLVSLMSGLVSLITSGEDAQYADETSAAPDG